MMSIALSSAPDAAAASISSSASSRRSGSFSVKASSVSRAAVRTPSSTSWPTLRTPSSISLPTFLTPSSTSLPMRLTPFSTSEPARRTPERTSSPALLTSDLAAFAAGFTILSTTFRAARSASFDWIPAHWLGSYCVSQSMLLPHSRATWAMYSRDTSTRPCATAFGWSCCASCHSVGDEMLRRRLAHHFAVDPRPCQARPLLRSTPPRACRPISRRYGCPTCRALRSGSRTCQSRGRCATAGRRGYRWTRGRRGASARRPSPCHQPTAPSRPPAGWRPWRVFAFHVTRRSCATVPVSPSRIIASCPAFMAGPTSAHRRKLVPASRLIFFSVDTSSPSRPAGLCHGDCNGSDRNAAFLIHRFDPDLIVAGSGGIRRRGNELRRIRPQRHPRVGLSVSNRKA